jgi:Tfp pilus assembly protein PilV
MRKSLPRPRRGGTLIELLVALLLLDLAILTLAAVSAVAARRIGDAGRLNRSTAAAANRLERTASRPCAALSNGSAVLERGVTEQWSARAIAGATEIADSIQILSMSHEQVVLRMRLPC